MSTVCQYIPLALLAAIVLPATRSLVSLSEARFYWRSSKVDFLHYAGTFLAVLVFDIQNGLLIGVGVSLASLLVQSFRPRLVELGVLPHSDVFVALVRFPAARRLPGLRIFRLDSALHFGNVAAIVGKLEEMLDTAARNNNNAATAAPMAAAGGQEGSSAGPGSGGASVQQAVVTVAEAGGAGVRMRDGDAADTCEVTLEGDRPGPTLADSTGAATAAAGQWTTVSPAVPATSTASVRAASAPALTPPSGPHARQQQQPTAARQVYTLQFHASPSLAPHADPDAGATDGHPLLDTSSPSASPFHPCPDNEACLSLPIRAVIIDASRVVRIDVSAIKELQTVIDAYAKSTLTPKPQLIFAGVPGPVRDAWDAYVAAQRLAGGKATPLVQYLSIAAAVASVNGAAVGVAREVPSTLTVTQTA